MCLAAVEERKYCSLSLGGRRKKLIDEQEIPPKRKQIGWGCDKIRTANHQSVAIMQRANQRGCVPCVSVGSNYSCGELEIDSAKSHAFHTAGMS